MLRVLVPLYCDNEDIKPHQQPGSADVAIQISDYSWNNYTHIMAFLLQDLVYIVSSQQVKLPYLPT